MTINKTGGGTPLQYPPLEMSLLPSQVFPVPAQQSAPGTFGGLAGGNLTQMTMTGQYLITLGPYLDLQIQDPILTGYWRNLAVPHGVPFLFSSDGVNFRIANTTGCPVGAIITNAGSSYTNGYNTLTSIVTSAGGATWNSIVGGAINTTVTITAGGTLYTKPPLLLVIPPAGQGSTPYIPATMTCTISGGAINAVTVVNQGAGYVAAPTVVVINQPGDTTGSGAVLTVNATLAGSGTLLWLGPSSLGTAGVTAVPTLTFTPASSTAATVIPNFTVTGVTVTNGGAGYGNAMPFAVESAGGQVAGSAANTNPFFDKNILMPRNVSIYGTSTAGGAVTATGLVIHDAGFGFQIVPTLYPVSGITGGAAPPTAVAQLTATVGGQTDTFLIQPI